MHGYLNMIKILTDSTSDLTNELQKNYDIDVIPMTIYFGEDHYIDGVDFTHDAFYQKLSSVETLPTTSQINPNQYADVLRKYIENNDEVIVLPISGKLSGTHQSAHIALDILEDENLDTSKIHIIDSLNVTMGLSILVIEASKMRAKGYSAPDIVKELETLKGNIRLIASLDTLKYLKMGGRLSAAGAFIGGVLGINPLIQIIDGEVASTGKERGRKNSYKKIKEFLNEHPIDADKTVIVAETYSNGYINDFIKIIGDNLEGVNYLFERIGCTVGTHIGPGAVGIAYVEK